MRPFFQNIHILFVACRGYSIPVSFMSWLVPFLYSALNGGNIVYGLFSLLGIVILHLATNIFDDAIDYTVEKLKIDKGIKSNFNFQKGKCSYILNNKITLKQAYLISVCVFLAAFITGLFFIYFCGLKLLYVIIPTALICILYPLLGSLGFGEILVSIIFSPLIYSGVFFIMTSNFSFDILILSISTGLLSVAVLHNHMLLDYRFDTENRKITLCRLCGSEKNALNLLGIIIAFSYINLIFWILAGKLNYFYLLPFLTLPKAVLLIKIMYTHINNPNEEIKHKLFLFNINFVKKISENDKSFILKFLTAQSLLSEFTIILCIAVIISGI